MKHLKILFDADDVAENLLECWLKVLNDRYGTNVSGEDVTEWNLSLAFPMLTKQQVYDVLHEDTVWANLAPMPGAQKYLQRLHDEGHELYMVTATDCRACSVKIERILSLFPFLDVAQIIIAHHKQMVMGDVLIDDGPHNLVGGHYSRILFDRPHNRNYPAESNGMIRVHNWDEIYDEITKMSGGMK